MGCEAVPRAGHSRPAFLKSPTNSFFVVPAEIIGCWRRMKAVAVALMCSNCALRSGCAPPSRVFCSACSRKPSRCNSRPIVDALTGQPCAVTAPASFALLFQVHRNGDIGSPRVTGSIKTTRVSVSSGRICSRHGRPAPGRRMRPGIGTPAANSRRPFRNRLPCEPGCRRRHRIASVPECGGLRGRPETAPALMEQRDHHHELGHQRRFEVRVALHRTRVRSRSYTT